MLSHVTLGTNNLAQAKIFYDKILGILGYRRVHEDNQYVGYCENMGENGRPSKPMFWICLPFNKEKATVGNGTHVAFMTQLRSNVKQAYELAISLGAQCEGAPDLRPYYHENYYGAFFRDLDGNKLQVCCHNPEIG